MVRKNIYRVSHGLLNKIFSFSLSLYLADVFTKSKEMIYYPMQSF